MATLSNRQFINSRETLIAVGTYKTGFYLTETNVIGTTYATAADALAAHQDDDITRFIRFDTDALTGEDVTEDMTVAFLDEFAHTPADEDMVPTFVRTSQAWEDWCSEYVSTPAFSQRLNGTYSHRLQGI